MEPEKRAIFTGEPAWTREGLTEARARAGDPPTPDPYVALIAAIRPPRWTTKAACKGMGPGAFHPEASEGRDAAAAAKEVCSRCPAIVPCLAVALADASLQGIWGGTSPQERQQLRRQAA